MIRGCVSPQRKMPLLKYPATHKKRVPPSKKAVIAPLKDPPTAIKKPNTVDYNPPLFLTVNNRKLFEGPSPIKLVLALRNTFLL